MFSRTQRDPEAPLDGCMPFGGFIRTVACRLSEIGLSGSGLVGTLSKLAGPIAYVRALQRVREMGASSDFEREFRWEQAKKALREVPEFLASDFTLTFKRPSPDEICAATASMRQKARRRRRPRPPSEKRSERKYKNAKKHLELHGIGYTEDSLPDLATGYPAALVINPEGDAPIQQLARKLAESGITVMYSPMCLARTKAGASYVRSGSPTRRSYLLLSDSEINNCSDPLRFESPKLAHEQKHVEGDISPEPGSIGDWDILMEGGSAFEGYGKFCAIVGELRGFAGGTSRAVQIAGETHPGSDDRILAAIDAMMQARRGEDLARTFHAFSSMCLGAIESEEPLATNCIPILSFGDMRIVLDAFQYDPNAPIDEPYRPPDTSTPVRAVITMYGPFGDPVTFTFSGPYVWPPSRGAESYDAALAYMGCRLEELPDGEWEAWKQNISVLEGQLRALQELCRHQAIFFHRNRNGPDDAAQLSLPVEAVRVLG